MSIEAIKAALAAYSNSVDAVNATQEGDDPHAAALAVQGVERAQEVWKTWTQPEYIAPLIERLEAAEKYAARLGWLTKQFRAMSLDMGGNHCWVLARSGSIRGPNMIAAIDSAMQSGGLAEGVE